MLPRVAGATADFGPPRDPRLKQHRCHPRVADLASTLLRLELPAAPHRARLLYRCLTSAVGEEPTDPFLLNPAEQALKQKVWRPKAAKQGETPPAAAEPAAADTRR